MLFFVPWRHVVTRSGLSRLWSAQPGEHSGAVYLWGALISNLILLSVSDYKLSHFLVPIFGLLGLITAHHLVSLERNRRIALFSTIAAFLAAAAIVVQFAAGWTRWPESVHGSLWVGGGLLISALLVWLSRRRGQLAVAMALCAGMSLTALPFYLITVHGLNAVMTPRSLGLMLNERAKRGQATVQYHKDYFGIFDYHAGRNIAPAASYDALDELIRNKPCGIVAIRQRDLDAWPNPPDDMKIVARQQLDYEDYVLALWGGPICG